MRAYIAGPLFNEGERWFDEQIDAIVQAAGYETFLPHRDGKEHTMTSDRAEAITRIFAEDLAALDACDLVVANLNGLMVDDGTAWEIGYAYARGKRIIGVRTDWRLSFPYQAVNLMIECSLNTLVRSLDDLRAALAD